MSEVCAEICPVFTIFAHKLRFFCMFYPVYTYYISSRLRPLALVASLLIAITVSAQTKWNSSYQQYIDRYKEIAIEQMKKYKIPASITLAQGVFESGAGKSDLARHGNNHFGIKCHGWTGRTVYYDDDARNECFRAYSNARESYEDHSRFLVTGQRYQSLFKLSIRDYKGWAHGLKRCGNATNPQYAQKLIGVIETYELYKYDRESPDRFISRHADYEDALGYTIYMNNKTYYVHARANDSFKNIAKHLRLSVRTLAKCNERDKRDVLQEGEIVYLKKKQTKAAKTFKHQLHVVQPGESMYSISQRYAIRLKSLYKMNRLSPDYQIQVGDKLRLR